MRAVTASRSPLTMSGVLLPDHAAGAAAQKWVRSIKFPTKNSKNPAVDGLANQGISKWSLNC